MNKISLYAALFVFIAFTASGPTNAAGYTQYIGFGDSTQDSGYFRYNTTGSAASDLAVAIAVAQGASGAYVGPGLMNSIIFAANYGLNGGPLGSGGTNFANGGAFTATLRISPGDPGLNGVSYATNVTTIQQIQNYLARVGGQANPNGIYMIKTGDNDLNFVRVVDNAFPGWLAANPTFLHDINVGLAASVAALQAAGARTIIVPNSYNYAVFAQLGGTIPDSNAVLYARSNAYHYDRWATLTRAGVRFVPADIDSLMRFVVTHPTLFGFTPASVLSANALFQALSPLLVTGSDVTPAEMQSSLFIGANGVHLTTAGQKIESDYESNLLNAPVQMSLLAETVIQGGLSRASGIQGQIDLSDRPRGYNGVNVWANAGVEVLSFKTPQGIPSASGAPFQGSTGADYLTSCGIVAGAAFSAGGQRQDFSTGGHFDQTDEALSLYAGYASGPLWADLVATYTLFQDTITREVPLGILLDRNKAETNGHSLALAARFGADIKAGLVSTGPVVGAVLQETYVKGFAETGFTGVTALSYGAQIRDSVVSQLGWRVKLDIGAWQPFLEAHWNHEWAGKDRMVKAALTTILTTPYVTAAAPVASDWATASLGASYKVSSDVSLRGSVSAMALNPQVVNYGGEFGVSVRF